MIKILQDIVPRSACAWLVGGAVRDLLMNRVPADLDIAVKRDTEQVARQTADRVSGSFVRMGKPGKIVFRVVYDQFTIDFTPLNGSTIEEDLKKRDFTINAMARSLSEAHLIDPTGGHADIRSGIVRMVTPGVFIKDPVRLVRAFRMGTALGFKLNPATVDAIRDNARRIGASAGERIREELVKMFRSPNVYPYLDLMWQTGLLQVIFPELVPLSGCGQNRYHEMDVLDHTMSAFNHLEHLLKEQFRSSLTRTMEPDQQPSNPDVDLLKLAVLLHDIGKPATRSVKTKGEVHFYGHDKKGAEMAEAVGRRLKLSVKQAYYLSFLIRNHLRPLHLFTAHQNATLGKRQKNRFFMKVDTFTPDLMLLASADFLAKTEIPGKRAAAFLEFAHAIISDYEETYIRKKKSPPLINGKDLIEHFGLSPSPLFKVILNRIEEERLAETINNREDALKRVNALLKEH